MNNYLMLSRRHYLGSDNKVVILSNLRKPYTIHVPWYMKSAVSPKQIGFEFSDKEAVPVMSNIVDTDTIDFGSWKLKVISGWQKFELYFRGYQMNISIASFTMANSGAASNTRKTHKVLDIEAVASTGWSRTCEKIIPDYEYLRPVGMLEHIKVNSGILNFGMTTGLFALKYRRVDFGGTCWVFFYGMIALILDDELGLDAIGVVLKVRTREGDGVGTLVLSDVLWTKNGYIQKAVMTNT